LKHNTVSVGEVRNVDIILVREFWKSRSLETYTRRCKDNIKKSLAKVEKLM